MTPAWVAGVARVEMKEKKARVHFISARPGAGSVISARPGAGSVHLCAPRRGFSSSLRAPARGEDALHATRAAVEEGIVAGGGTALLNCIGVIEALELTGDERVGAMIVRRAPGSPLRPIAINAGQHGAVVVQNVRAAGKKNWGYSAARDVYEDLVASGVIDPTKVMR